MKKIAGYAAAFLAGAILSGSTAVFASSKHYVQAELRQISMTEDGNNVTTSQVPSLVYNGATYVQLYTIMKEFKDFKLLPYWGGYNFNVATPADPSEVGGSGSSSSSSTPALTPDQKVEQAIQHDWPGINSLGMYIPVVHIRENQNDNGNNWAYFTVFLDPTQEDYYFSKYDESKKAELDSDFQAMATDVEKIAKENGYERSFISIEFAPQDGNYNVSSADNVSNHIIVLESGSTTLYRWQMY